jgi:hypothetical protein
MSFSNIALFARGFVCCLGVGLDFGVRFLIAFIAVIVATAAIATHKALTFLMWYLYSNSAPGPDGLPDSEFPHSTRREEEGQLGRNYYGRQQCLGVAYGHPQHDCAWRSDVPCG